MSTIGWFLIICAVVLGRFAAYGRGVSDLPGDLGDLITGVVTGDYDSVREVLDRRGSNLEADQATNVAPVEGGALAGLTGGLTGNGLKGPIDVGIGGGGGGAVLAKMKQLGAGKRYVLGATGPNAYDCSGLLWRALQDTGKYDGPRFTTHNWESIAAKIGAEPIPSAEPGAVVWFPGHIGVCEDSVNYFSALNPTRGIVTQKIATTANGRTTKFWRLK